MTTAQEVISRLKAEIERRKQSLRAGICNPDAFTRKQKLEMLVASEELDRLNRFLDNLSEEPDNNLEEEVKNYFQGYWPGTETAEQCNTDLHFTPPAIMRLARHFAEWGAEHLRDSTKMIDESLEEAAENAMPKEPAYFADEFTEDGPKSEPVYNVEQMKAMYKAGAEYEASKYTLIGTYNKDEYYIKKK